MTFPITFRSAPVAIALLGLAAIAAAANPAATAATPAADPPLQASVPFMGGVGGVYFFAPPGELVIEVDKRDLNRRDARTELRAILVGPDRRVLQEAVIPDDGRGKGAGLGPIQSCRLTTHVESAGVHVLNITISQDRYGEESVWSFRSNCPKYLIETARGHRDARHEEPIVLASPDRAADVCFRPRAGAFRIELSRLPAGAPPAEIFDANGRRLATLRVGPKGEAAHEFAAAPARPGAPWRLHLPSAQATVAIDGVTRWDPGDLLPDACLWTPEPDSWFPLHENRWLLTPYSRRAAGTPGQRTSVEFDVRNDSPRERTIELALESANRGWPVELSPRRVTLAAGKSATITATATVPARGDSRAVRVRATPADGSGFTTYSTLTVTGGLVPAEQPLAMPIVLKPYQHENEQFGYAPDYPVENQIYFDLQNRPFVSTSKGIATLTARKWTFASLPSGASAATPKFAFDRENRVYVLGAAGGVPALHMSVDGGRTFTSAPIPARERPARGFDLEVFTGHNVLPGPPPILRYTQTAKDEKLFWRSLNDLDLFLPRIEQGRLIIGEPILITRQCIGLSTHSGSPASVVSHGRKVHLVWGEATDPAIKVPGVPACAATFDRDTGKLGARVILGYGAPANDIHNSPSITMDGDAHLHVLGGTHGRPFPYARSLRPNDAGGGWTEAVPTGEAVNQTYIGLVCGSDGTLHAAFRLWRYQSEPHPASSHATLAYQRKRPGEPWEAPRVLVVSPFSEYSIFYHRLTIDRRGRLFLSYDYYSTFWFYRNDPPARRRTLLLSPDAGDTWKLAAGDDFR